MELVVVRHAIAEDREAFARTGKDDAARPLTRKSVVPSAMRTNGSTNGPGKRWQIPQPTANSPPVHTAALIMRTPI